MGFTSRSEVNGEIFRNGTLVFKKKFTLIIGFTSGQKSELPASDERDLNL